MKRILTIVFSVFVIMTLVLSFSSCNRLGYINQALSNAGSWDAVDFDVKTNVQATVADTTEELSSEYSVKIKYIQSYDPLAMARTKVTLYGETIPAEVYYANGSYYVLTNNDAVKLRTGNLIEGSAFVADWKNILTAIPSDSIKSAEEKDNGDGTKTATMPMDAATFETIYRNVLNEWHNKLVSQYASGSSVSNMTVTEPKISITVDSQSGVLKSYSGECRLEVLAESSSGDLVKVSAVFTQTLSCNANGKDVAFDLPEDYEEYKISDGINLDSNKILSGAVSDALALADMDASLRLTLGAESLSIKNIQAKGIGTDAWNFNWNETLLLNDKEVKNEVYYTNGWYYTNVYGELAHLKYERSEETDGYYGYEKDYLDLLKNLSAAEYKTATAVSNQDGTRTFTISLSPTRFQQVYGELVTEAKTAANLSGTTAVSNSSVELIVDKKGVLKSYSISFSLATKDGENTVSYDFSYCLTYHALGEAVMVTPLEGYEMFFTALERKQEFFGDVGKAIENLLGADSLNAYIFYSQYADVGVPFFQIDKQQESVTAAVDMKTNPKHFTKFVITDQGDTRNEEVYFEDGFFYIKSDKDSLKTDGEDLTEQNVFWMIQMIQMLPEKYFDRMSFATEGKNNVLSVELTIDELLELFPGVEIMEGVSLETLLQLTTYQKVKESKISITLNEANELVSYEVKLSADFAASLSGLKLEGEAKLEIYYEFNSERSEISITPPEGYKDFKAEE